MSSLYLFFIITWEPNKSNPLIISKAPFANPIELENTVLSDFA